jgi:hypothetical protein
VGLRGRGYICFLVGVQDGILGNSIHFCSRLFVGLTAFMFAFFFCRIGLFAAVSGFCCLALGLGEYCCCIMLIGAGDCCCMR